MKTEFKNMKFEVNGNLDEIVTELESKGYRTIHTTSCSPIHKWVVADCDGIYLGWFDAVNLCDKHYPLTTIAELKEM